MRLLWIEPFFGGSHAAFLEALTTGLEQRYGVESTVLTMPARHWKWRMRGAAAWLAETQGEVFRRGYDLVFASSFLPLAELIGLCPGLAGIPRVLYFHENQLAYPVRSEFHRERDRHYGFTQMVSAQAATACVFNSAFNRDSFLDTGATWLAQMPDARPTGWRDAVAARSLVLGLPMDLPARKPDSLAEDPGEDRGLGPRILWNHRWEHDKNPAAFFDALRVLGREGVGFRLLVCGERFKTLPEEMLAAKREFAEQIDHWGFVPDRAGYLDLLGRAHLAVSTADHEFFGLSMLEATWAGARPLVPDRLSYPELFPPEYCYRDLVPELRRLCSEWSRGERDLRGDRRGLVEAFAPARLVPRYWELFQRLVAGPVG